MKTPRFPCVLPTCVRMNTSCRLSPKRLLPSTLADVSGALAWLGPAALSEGVERRRFNVKLTGGFEKNGWKESNVSMWAVLRRRRVRRCPSGRAAQREPRCNLASSSDLEPGGGRSRQLLVLFFFVVVFWNSQLHTRALTKSSYIKNSPSPPSPQKKKSSK